MPQALRLTDRTKFKIETQISADIKDLQAMMEHYSDGILRPYVILEPYVATGNLSKRNWLLVTDEEFHRSFHFVDEEDPCMFTDIEPN